MYKIMICDDSAFMRKIFADTIEKDPELVAEIKAFNGQDALRKLKRTKIDLVLLDIEMPKLNGLQTLEKIKAEYPQLPVIMVSALDERENVFKALDLGAFDFIAKPSGTTSLNIDSIKEELLRKVKAALKSSREKTNKKEKQSSPQKQSQIKVVAVGSSSGGPKALKKLFSEIPNNFPAAFVIVQHMPAGFTKTLAERLDRISGLKIKEAAKGDKIKAGTALLAPGDYHLEFDAKGRVELNKKARKHGVRPCVDYMMTSLSRKFSGPQLLGVILTGMGHDGAEGMKSIIEQGAYGIIESRETALVYGMPAAAAKLDAYDEIQPLDNIASRIIELVEG